MPDVQARFMRLGFAYHMEATALHPWNVSPQEAVGIQKRLRSLVRLTPLRETPRLVGGVDVSMMRGSDVAFAGIVVMTYPELEVTAYALSDKEAPMPYIPGLLSFRELPAVLSAWNALETKPDLLLVDGHGVAHPRRLGIAAHLGLATETPSIGVGKSVLVGEYDEPAPERGSQTLLRDKGEWVGSALRSKDGVKPLFVSPGHLVALDEAADFVMTCVRGYRLPEPTRLAHEYVNKFRNGEIK